MDQSDMMEPGEALQSLDHALEAASRAEKRLREAIEVLPEGIVFLDENDRYILWNKRYSEIYERSADLLEPGGHFVPSHAFVVGDHGEARADILLRYAHLEEDVNFVLRFLRRTTMQDAEITYRLVTHDDEIRVRWSAKMYLRDPAFGLTTLNIIDGVSVYELDTADLSKHFGAEKGV